MLSIMRWVLIYQAFSRAWSMSNIGSRRFFPEKLKIKSGALVGHLSTICFPPWGGGGGGNKQAYLLKFNAKRMLNL